jgi:sugar phosphate isomerase/epimerase
MFELAVFTDEITQDVAKACRVCNDFGFTGLEIRTVWDTPVQKLTDAQVTELVRVAGGHGLRVASIGSPFGKCELDDRNEVAAHMDILRRCADIARECGCRIVRGFAFWDHGRRERPWDAMLRAYEPVPAILQEKDVILGLENEAACYVGTAGHVREFLDRLDCDRVQAVWDPANHVHDPDGDGMRPFPEGYALIRDDIVHVHMKDAMRHEDGSRANAFLGEGVVDWPEQLRALMEDGYEGYVSLETHVKADAIPPALRKTYGHCLEGDAKEGASKACMAWMRDAVASLRA